jgi:hypothetical protein
MQETGILNIFLRTIFLSHTEHKMSREFEIVNFEEKPQGAHGE